LNRKSKN